MLLPDIFPGDHLKESAPPAISVVDFPLHVVELFTDRVGVGFTKIVTMALPVHTPSSPNNVYDVEVAGLTVTSGPVGGVVEPAGSHVKFPAALTISVTGGPGKHVNVVEGMILSDKGLILLWMFSVVMPTQLVIVFVTVAVYVPGLLTVIIDEVVDPTMPGPPHEIEKFDELEVTINCVVLFKQSRLPWGIIWGFTGLLIIILAVEVQPFMAWPVTV
jgi:hypothetical protein